jgi:hypothetical protein
VQDAILELLHQGQMLSKYFDSNTTKGHKRVVFIKKKCHDVDYGQEKNYNITSQQEKLKIKEEKTEMK